MQINGKWYTEPQLAAALSELPFVGGENRQGLSGADGGGNKEV